MTNANECCGNCRFWIPEPDIRDPEDGTCVRHAPRIVPQHEIFGIGPTQGLWPLIQNYQWCGEFQPKQKGEGE